ncbi:hypothetical protein EO087_00065 [Dyella sp. M7H15-1]|nr:hypothetical protein EO087_00065 [Dyella sp. M7H15-1]
MNPLDRAVAIFDSQAALARAMGGLPQEIHRWIKRGWVPANRCQAVVAAVNKELPSAMQRGLVPEIARPLTLHELNSVFPPPQEREAV